MAWATAGLLGHFIFEPFHISLSINDDRRLTGFSSGRHSEVHPVIILIRVLVRIFYRLGKPLRLLGFSLN